MKKTLVFVAIFCLACIPAYALDTPLAVLQPADMKALAQTIKTVTGAVVNVGFVIMSFLFSIDVLIKLVKGFSNPSHLSGKSSDSRESAFLRK